MTSGHRPTNCWNSGDLPGPYAEGDIIDVPADAKTLERMRDMPPGRYKIVYATSIDEGDAWYFRLAKKMTGRYEPCSDRLHVNSADRSSFDDDCDWLEGCTLHKTADPDGLALREQMLADGWQWTPPATCKSCGRRLP